MKRWISWILAMSLILGMAVVPAAAEGNGSGMDAVTSASVNAKGRDSRKNAPDGQVQDGEAQNGQTYGQKRRQPGAVRTRPAVPESTPDEAVPESTPDEAAPEDTAGTDNASAQASGKKRDNKNIVRTGKKGKAAGAAATQEVTFELLLEKGVISREVYDAIMRFIGEYTAETAAPETPAAGDAATT